MAASDKTQISRGKGGGTPNPVDIYVGGRLRARRTLVGLSQEKLAEAIGLTFQQVQKYEMGKNRISASRLYQFSKILEVPVAYFFDNYSDGGSRHTSGPAMGFAEGEQDAFVNDSVMHERETLELIRVYYSIKDPKLRKDLLKWLKQMVAKAQAG